MPPLLPTVLRSISSNGGQFNERRLVETDEVKVYAVDDDGRTNHRDHRRSVGFFFFFLSIRTACHRLWSCCVETEQRVCFECCVHKRGRCMIMVKANVQQWHSQGQVT